MQGYIRRIIASIYIIKIMIEQLLDTLLNSARVGYFSL